jgi:hypothetical protein
MKMTVLAAVVLALGSLAQDVQLTPRFVGGDAFALTITKSLDDSTWPDAKFSASQVAHVRVTAGAPDDVRLDWQPGEPVVTGAPLGPSLMMVLGLKATAGLHFTVVLDRTAHFVRIANVEDLAPAITAARDRVLEATRQALPPAQRNSIDAAFVGALTPSNLADMVREAIKVYTEPFGISAPIGQAIDQPDTMPSPVGGPPVPSLIRGRIESATADRITLVKTETADAAAVVAALTDRLKRSGQSIPPGGLPVIGIVDEYRYVFDRQLGLVREGALTRRATSGPDLRVDRMAITMSEAPKR